MSSALRAALRRCRQALGLEPTDAQKFAAWVRLRARRRADALADMQRGVVDAAASTMSARDAVARGAAREAVVTRAQATAAATVGLERLADAAREKAKVDAMNAMLDQKIKEAEQARVAAPPDGAEGRGRGAPPG